MLRRACRLVLPFLGLLLAGCGTSTPPLAEVSGTVTYHGQPLPGGVVIFTPDESKGSTGPIATATIQPDGRFTLQTGPTPGAVAGWHRVSVVSVSETDPTPAGYQFAIPTSLIPERYRNPDLSGLSREVHRGEKNVLAINLD